jgi:hypothetical protein
MRSVRIDDDGDGERPVRRRTKRSEFAYILESDVAKATGFRVEGNVDPVYFIKEWEAHLGRHNEDAKKILYTQAQRDAMEQFDAYVKFRARHNLPRDKYVDEARALERLKLPDALQVRFFSDIAGAWANWDNTRTRERLDREREREAMEAADSPHIAHLVGTYQRTQPGYKSINLFYPWPSGTTTHLPMNLLADRLPDNLGDDPIESFFGASDVDADASKSPGAVARIFEGRLEREVINYVTSYQEIVKTREASIPVFDRWRRGHTVEYGFNQRVKMAGYFYALARGPLEGAGPAAGLPFVQDIAAQTQYIKDKNVTESIVEYTQHSYEILDVVRSMFDERKDHAGGIHKEYRIEMSNDLLAAVYGAPRSKAAMLVSRFQRDFAGWPELEALSAASAAVAEAEMGVRRATPFESTRKDKTREQRMVEEFMRRSNAFIETGAKKLLDQALTKLEQTKEQLLGKWKTSTSFLSTSYNPKFTFDHTANVYIVYHLHQDCPWMWMLNDNEAEILLPPGVEMCAIRYATVTPEAPGPMPIVYVLEVLVREKERIKPYDRPPKPEEVIPASPSYGPMSPVYVPPADDVDAPASPVYVLPADEAPVSPSGPVNDDDYDDTFFGPTSPTYGPMSPSYHAPTSPTYDAV